MREAETCLQAGACRAAMVLGWSATVYHLYRIVESNGLDLFCQSYNKKYKADSKIKPDASIDQIREKVKDRDLLEICHRQLGLLNSDEHYRLDQFRDWRNQSAHPSSQSPRPEEAQWYLVSVMSPLLARPVYIEHFPVEFIKHYFDPDDEDPLELADHQAELLIQRVRPDNYMHLMGELLQAYLSSSHYRVHGNVSKLRKFLTEFLDTKRRKQTSVLRVYWHVQQNIVISPHVKLSSGRS
ncbi:MAG: hypothetical protein M5U01_41925 [Ardenticatenaceae bacterium]|nr:hypothetical protein [Ardenticatenaceae bacterium]